MLAQGRLFSDKGARKEKRPPQAAASWMKTGGESGPIFVFSAEKEKEGLTILSKADILLNVN